MAHYTIPCFGQLDLEALEEYYDSELEHGNYMLAVDLNFEGTTLSEAKAGKIKNFLENIARFDAGNKKALLLDFREKESTTADYINYYLEELSAEELAGIIDVNHSAVGKARQFLEKLRLVRVGLYPDGEECFGVFDYSIDIDGEPQDQLLVVKTDDKGELDHITWES